MPVMHIHLKKGAFGEEQLEALMEQSSALYAQVFECPIARVRVFINEYRGTRMAVAGVVQSAVDASGAPYYEFIALEGRPQQQIERLHAGFSELIAETLRVDLADIRGACWTVSPEHWAIAGRPATGVRAAEIAARTP